MRTLPFEAKYDARSRQSTSGTRAHRTVENDHNKEFKNEQHLLEVEIFSFGAKGTEALPGLRKSRAASDGHSANRSAADHWVVQGDGQG
jgi:hypothetical protein